MKNLPHIINTPDFAYGDVGQRMVDISSVIRLTLSMKHAIQPVSCATVMR